MADEVSLEQKVADLAKHIQDQSRFTRAIVLVCTAALMAVIFYVMTEIYSTLPGVIILSFKSDLPNIIAQWRFTEAAQNKNKKMP